MKLMTRFMGTAVVATAALFTALPSAPLHAEGGTLVIVGNQVPRHLNGAVQSGIATAVPSTQIFASPLRYDADWSPQPYLAESWEVAEDGLSLTLNLVQNATFHDDQGEPSVPVDVRPGRSCGHTRRPYRRHPPEPAASGAFAGPVARAGPDPAQAHL